MHTISLTDFDPKVDLYYNVSIRYYTRFTGLDVATTAKGLSQSRVQPSAAPLGVLAVSDPVSEEQTDPATALFAEKLQQTAKKYEKVLNDQYDCFFRGHTAWDITYDVFKRQCTRVLRTTADTLADRVEQILLVFANCCYIHEELRQAGGDVHRQNEFTKHVGQYLVEHGFQPWIREQGGWVSDKC